MTTLLQTNARISNQAARLSALGLRPGKRFRLECSRAKTAAICSDLATIRAEVREKHPHRSWETVFEDRERAAEEAL